MASKSRSASIIKPSQIVNKTKGRSIGSKKANNIISSDFNLEVVSRSIQNDNRNILIDAECLIISEGKSVTINQITSINEFQFESKQLISKEFVNSECVIISEGPNPISIITEIKDYNISAISDISVFSSCMFDSIDSSIIDDPFILISDSYNLLASIIINSFDTPNVIIKHLHYRSASSRKNIRSSDNIVRYSILEQSIVSIESVSSVMVYKSIKNNRPISITNKRENIVSQINEGYDNIQLIHSSKNNAFLFNNTEVFIMSENISNTPILTDWINYPSITILSEDSKPPSGISGSNNGAGDGMKNFRLIVQKNAYIEYALEFNNKVISNITGLPNGIIFDKLYLKGSPNISGKYNILIKFTDSTSIPGTIIVTQIHRKL